MAKWTLDDKDNEYLRELTDRLRELEREVDDIQRELRELR